MPTWHFVNLHKTDDGFHEVFDSFSDARERALSIGGTSIHHLSKIEQGLYSLAAGEIYVADDDMYSQYLQRYVKMRERGEIDEG